MLEITAVEPQKRNKERFNIYAGGEYIASLGGEACAACGIRSGVFIREEELKEAVARDNERWAFDSAASLLAHSAKTKAELAERLKIKGIDETAAAAAINKLEEYGYINDAAYAAEYTASALSQGKSRRAAEYALKSKGLGRDVIACALLAYTDEAERESALRSLRTLARAGKDRRNLYAALSRRGFDYDTIKAVLPEEED